MQLWFIQRMGVQPAGPGATCDIRVLPSAREISFSKSENSPIPIENSTQATLFF